MTITFKTESLLLFVGDIIIFIFALWVTLIVRYFEMPQSTLFYNHLIPFSFLFVVWVLVFFIAGLYGKHTVLFKRRLSTIILNAQVINILIAVVFFFFIPYFGIAPKTNLLIYLVVSSGLIVWWRLFLFPTLGIRKKQQALLIGSGKELRELEEEVNNNTRYNLTFIARIDLDEVNASELTKGVEEAVRDIKVPIIVIDTKDERVIPALPELYSLIFFGVQFIDVSKMYEGIFDRVPLSFVKQNWLIENVSLSSKPGYDFLKRAFDIVVSLFLGIFSLVVYPFVAFAITLEDGGSILYTAERIGKNGKHIYLKKFRSMSESQDETVTRVGRFLRTTRIDELPQLWAVLRGDLSLIGPRPEIPYLVALYEQQISYYNIRHLIKPGLSGWAQINDYNVPRRKQLEVEKTMRKLSFDLYYVKNRSIITDIKIALFTIKTLFSRSGL